MCRVTHIASGCNGLCDVSAKSVRGRHLRRCRNVELQDLTPLAPVVDVRD